MSQARYNVLYVDDVPQSLESFEDLFEDDYEVFTATGGQEALDLLAEQEIHIILSDQIMPQMSGVEFLEKAQELYPDIQRILITGYSDIGAVIDAINKCNIYGYIHKPWKLDQMQHMLEKACEAYQLKLDNRNLIQHLEKKVEERTREVLRKNQRLEELNEEKNTLMGVVAHDLRNPIAQISGLSYLMKKSVASAPGLEEYIEKLDGVLVRMNNMVNHILNVENAESQDLGLELKPTPLVPLVTASIENLLHKSQEKQIQLQWAPPESTTPKALVDERYLLQVIENLLSNAIKYSPKGSTTTLALTATENQVCLSIKDEGPGIPEKAMPLLFSKYRTLGTQATNGETSTGLGLAIVKRYVDAMNGRVWCESTLGQGTSFLVQFDVVS